jgi:hypothetical protein
VRHTLNLARSHFEQVIYILKGGDKPAHSMKKRAPRNRVPQNNDFEVCCPAKQTGLVEGRVSDSGITGSRL